MQPRIPNESNLQYADLNVDTVLEAECTSSNCVSDRLMDASIMTAAKLAETDNHGDGDRRLG